MNGGGKHWPDSAGSDLAITKVQVRILKPVSAFGPLDSSGLQIDNQGRAENA